MSHCVISKYYLKEGEKKCSVGVCPSWVLPGRSLPAAQGCVMDVLCSLWLCRLPSAHTEAHKKASAFCQTRHWKSSLRDLLSSSASHFRTGLINHCFGALSLSSRSFHLINPACSVYICSWAKGRLFSTPWTNMVTKAKSILLYSGTCISCASHSSCV